MLQDLQRDRESQDTHLNPYRRTTVRLLRIWMRKEVHYQGSSEHSYAHSHWGKAICMHFPWVRQEILLIWKTQDSSKDPHGRKASPMRGVWKEIYWEREPENSHLNSHRREAVHLRLWELWEVIHNPRSSHGPQEKACWRETLQLFSVWIEVHEVFNSQGSYANTQRTICDSEDRKGWTLSNDHGWRVSKSRIKKKKKASNASDSLAWKTKW